MGCDLCVTINVQVLLVDLDSAAEIDLTELKLLHCGNHPLSITLFLPSSW